MTKIYSYTSALGRPPKLYEAEVVKQTANQIVIDPSGSEGWGYKTHLSRKDEVYWTPAEAIEAFLENTNASLNKLAAESQKLLKQYNAGHALLDQYQRDAGQNSNK